jgi:hypothetical protein
MRKAVVCGRGGCSAHVKQKAESQLTLRWKENRGTPHIMMDRKQKEIVHIMVDRKQSGSVTGRSQSKI